MLMRIEWASHLGRVAEQPHRCVCHAWELNEGTLDGHGAGAACHATYGQLQAGTSIKTRSYCSQQRRIIIPVS